MNPTGVILGLLAGCGLALLLISGGAERHVGARVREGHLRRLLVAAGHPHLHPAALVAASAACGVVLGAASIVVVPVPMVGVLAAGMGALLPLLLLRRRARARQRALQAAWPDAIDTLTSAARAGLSLPEAVADLARSGPRPLQSAFAAFGREYHATGAFGPALDLLQRDLADPVADRVVAALRLSREFGGTDLGIVLRTLSAMVREDARTRGEIAARQSWTVAAARMAVAAPWLTLALLCTRPEAVRAYASPAGVAVITIAATLSVVAYALMMRIGRLPADERIAP